MMLMLISHSLYDFSQHEFYHGHPLHIPICHTSHILWKNLQAYNIGESVLWKSNIKTKHIPIFLELCRNSMSFTPFIHKISPRTIHTIYVQECASLLPKEISNNIIFLFQECDTHNRKHLVGRSDFPGSPKLHTIDLEFLNQNALHRLTMTELSKK